MLCHDVGKDSLSRMCRMLGQGGVKSPAYAQRLIVYRRLVGQCGQP